MATVDIDIKLRFQQDGARLTLFQLLEFKNWLDKRGAIA